MTDRLERLREALEGARVDALLVGNAQNRRYLSNFTGSAGMVLITADSAMLATDFRYVEQAPREAPAFTIFTQDGPMAEWLPRFLEGLGGRRVGFEAQHTSVAAHKQLRKIVSGIDAAARPALVQTEGIVEQLRARKDPAELDSIQRAVRLGDDTFAHVSARIKPGWTEQQVAWELERYAREHGAEAMSFPTIVGGGPWGAMPHCHPRDVPIAAGEPIVIDMGVVVDGYCSDMTRTIVLGQPDAEFQRIYDIVLTAQETAAATVESGMTGAEVHRIAQRIIEDAGYGDRFGHGLGHGVGLEIHELPRVGKSSDDRIEDGMIITVEPGIYLPGWGGIRIEDMGVMENGTYRNFTASPKLRMLGV